MENHTVTLTIGYVHLTIINTNRFHNESNPVALKYSLYTEDIDKKIRFSLSIFWDIAVQGGNEVMRYLVSLYLSMCHEENCGILPKRLDKTTRLWSR